MLANSYKAGADWRINSVWHDASEEPERLESTVLVEIEEFGIEGYIYDTIEAVDYGRILRKRYSSVRRWAYVEDLIPDRKESQL